MLSYFHLLLNNHILLIISESHFWIACRYCCSFHCCSCYCSGCECCCCGCCIAAICCDADCNWGCCWKVRCCICCMWGSVGENRLQSKPSQHFLPLRYTYKTKTEKDLTFRLNPGRTYFIFQLLFSPCPNSIFLKFLRQYYFLTLCIS